MGIIATDKRTLSGYLVGIGKRRADGSEDFQFIKPVKNMIVKQGLNNWLRYNNSNSDLLSITNSGQIGNLFKWPTANIAFCCYGLDNTPNDFGATTDLAQLPNQAPYSTKKTGWPFCGSGPYDNAGKYRVRISHISPAAPANYAVKEIGYYSDNSAKPLFSRIALPFTYNLYAGEQLITTYELILNFPYSYSETSAVQTTLKDANGVDLEAISKFTVAVSSAGNSNFPAITEAGSMGISLGDGYIRLLAPVFSKLSYNFAYTAIYYKESAKDFPVNNAGESTASSNLSVDTGNSHVNLTTLNYVYDSFQRDIRIDIPSFWPKMSLATEYKDIYYMNFFNFALKFGHTIDGVFTPTPWRKYANHTARFVYRQAIATAESIAWQQNQ